MVELRILTGLHRGAALPVEGDTIRIGSGAESDIVLLDPGMPAAASVIYRSGASWRYRSYRSTQPRGETLDEAPDGTALVAGARWFAGPVLIGCEEEGTPWSDASAPSDASQRNDREKPPKSRKRASSAMFVVLVALVGLAALIALIAAVLAWRSGPRNPAPASARPASAVNATADTPGATVRVITGTLYPNEAIGRPPFTIRSASSGPYGFVVTDDDHVLIPGSRWRAFTLVRIEPGRAVFTGPHAAELTW
ncbi:MAG: FHA domain-containing protein [Trinickia sp.]